MNSGSSYTNPSLFRPLMNLSLDGKRLNGLLKAISYIHSRLGDHMCVVVSPNCSWLHMFSMFSFGFSIYIYEHSDYYPKRA